MLTIMLDRSDRTVSLKRSVRSSLGHCLPRKVDDLLEGGSPRVDPIVFLSLVTVLGRDVRRVAVPSSHLFVIEDEVVAVLLPVWPTVLDDNPLRHAQKGAVRDHEPTKDAALQIRAGERRAHSVVGRVRGQRACLALPLPLVKVVPDVHPGIERSERSTQVLAVF